MKEKQLVSIDKISSGSDSVEKKDQRDKTDKLEENTLEISKLSAEVEALEQSNQDLKANRELRSDYAKKVYHYLLWYSSACVVLLLLSGFKASGFALPDTVLTVVVGSTAAAAIGLVGWFCCEWFVQKLIRTKKNISN